MYVNKVTIKVCSGIVVLHASTLLKTAQLEGSNIRLFSKGTAGDCSPMSNLIYGNCSAISVLLYGNSRGPVTNRLATYYDVYT